MQPLPDNGCGGRNEKSLFAIARELTDCDQRRAFLDQACARDAAMRRRLDEMLAALPEAEQFFAEGAAALEMPTQVAIAVSEKPGDRIGRYKLLQQIGEGGCGVVYMAEQEEPVRRRVALKVIKLGMDTKSVIARFEAERQALALMDHPNIAKVFDAGAIGDPHSQSPLSLSTSPGPTLLRHGTGPGHQDHRLLRPEQPLDPAAAGPVHPGLSRHPARPPKRDHPPGHQTLEHPGHASTTGCRYPR